MRRNQEVVVDRHRSDRDSHVNEGGSGCGLLIGQHDEDVEVAVRTSIAARMRPKQDNPLRIPSAQCRNDAPQRRGMSHAQVDQASVHGTIMPLSRAEWRPNHDPRTRSTSASESGTGG
jgi:hypothetical protein